MISVARRRTTAPRRQGLCWINEAGDLLSRQRLGTVNENLLRLHGHCATSAIRSRQKTMSRFESITIIQRPAAAECVRSAAVPRHP